MEYFATFCHETQTLTPDFLLLQINRTDLPRNQQSGALLHLRARDKDKRSSIKQLMGPLAKW